MAKPAENLDNLKLAASHLEKVTMAGFSPSQFDDLHEALQIIDHAIKMLDSAINSAGKEANDGNV